MTRRRGTTEEEQAENLIEEGLGKVGGTPLTIPEETEEDEALPPPAPPDPFAVMDRLAAAMEAMAAKQATNATDPNVTDMMAKLAAALERVSEASIEGAKIQAAESRRIHRPSNDVVPMTSTLNPRGQRDFPKPPLKCVMLIPWLADYDSLTREEVQLLNLLEPGTFVVRKMDGTKVKIDVQITYGLDEVTPSRLLMNHETAFNNDNHKWMPPLVDLLRQIHHASKNATVRAQAAAVLSQDEEEALIASGELTVSA